jgi:hypothetical protein
VLIGLLFLTTQKGHIMSFEEYAKVKHATPYVVRTTFGSGKLVYFGIKHTRNPKDKQIDLLRTLWGKTKPTLVLNEDITPEPHATFEESVKYDGERGALAFWAKLNKTQIRSIDMSWKQEAQKLSESFPAASVKVFYVLRGLQQDLKRPGAGDANQIARQELDHLKKLGLTAPPNSIEEIDKLWSGMNIKGEWRKPRIQWIDPTGSGRFNAISARSSSIRDRYMIDFLTQELKKGKRILAVVGASHVVMQEPALPGKVSRR